jgi:phosphatidate cytidylyltransferase
MLFKRVLTVLFLLPAVIYIVFQKNNDIFVFSLMFVLIFAIQEYCNLASLKGGLIKIIYTFSLLLIFYFLNKQTIHFMPYWILSILFLSSFWWLLNIYLISSFPKHSEYWHKNLALRLLIGFLVFIPMMLSLTAIHRIDSKALMLLLSLVWAADCGGYFFGKALGKNKLCPNVSPGKTVEGALGGVFLSLVVVGLYLFFISKGSSATDYFYFSALSISVFKRLANVKDSGALLPGHGGLLDRIDSLTAAAPFFFLFYVFIT